MSTLPDSTATTTDPQSTVEESTERITRRYLKGSRPARVTRISIESSLTDEAEASRPRLKQGVYISQPRPDEEKSLVIASAHHAISIHHPGARAIIAKLDGQHCAIDISKEIHAPLDVVEKVISELEITQLLDVTHSKIRLHNRFQSPIAERAANTDDQSNDASFRQLQLRMSPELSQTTWIPGVWHQLKGIQLTKYQCDGQSLEIETRSEVNLPFKVPFTSIDSVFLNASAGTTNQVQEGFYLFGIRLH